MALKINPGDETIIAEGTAANIDITLTPKAAGNLILDVHTWPNADGTSGDVLTTDGVGILTFGDITTIGGTLTIAKGGTGQTTQTAAFDALAPTTTKGDITVHNGTDNIRLAVGTDNQVLTADSAQASGVKWAAGGGGGGITINGVQARRTTTFSPTLSYQDVTLDATDVETDATEIEHDNTNTDRITLKAAGLYEIWYKIDMGAPSANSSTQEIQARVRVNDTTVINGSDAECTVQFDNSIGQGGNSAVSNSLYSAFGYVATANDFVTLQLRDVDLGGGPDGVTLAGGVIFGAIRLSS